MLDNWDDITNFSFFDNKKQEEENKATLEPQEGAIIKVRGRISRVTYPKSGYNQGDWAVFHFKAEQIVEGELPYPEIKEYDITFSGKTPSLSPSIDYCITGKLIKSKYGWQYDVIMMNEDYDLTNYNTQKVFLSTILPPKILTNLYAKFDNPIDLLKRHDIKSLITVSGIKEQTALKLIQKYENSIDMGPAYVELMGYGLTKHMIDKLVKQFNSATTLVNMIKENPYLLIDYADGIGWNKADDLAKNMGIEENSQYRLEAYAKYYLTSLAENSGHTWIYDVNLINAIAEIAPTADRELIRTCIVNKIKDGTLFYIKEERKIGKTKYRVLEENITEELKRIANGPKISVDGIQETIEECEKNNGWEYTDEQKEIIRSILEDDNLVVVTGKAGCGKSSVMYPIVEVFKKNHKSVVQCALSGKAALNLTEITKVEGKTIHRTLGFRDGGFIHDKMCPLSDDVIIVDEVSMIGGEIFYSLIQSVKDGAKLICIGDVGQLEAIGLCNCLNDIINSKKIKHFHLNKIMRQAEDSAIITEAGKIYDGKDELIPYGFYGREIRGIKQDFEIISANDTDDCAKWAIAEFDKAYNQLGYSIDDICILTSKRVSGAASARVLNERIHNLLHPNINMISDKDYLKMSYSDGKGGHYDIKYMIGDKIKVTKNCYDTVNEIGDESPVFNGNLGTILWIDKETKSMCAKFLQGNIILTETEICNLQLGYAITTHSAQGSGFPYIIAICDPSAYTLNCKEMLYTQLTRAKKHCILIGPTNTIKSSCKKTNVREKQTWLSNLICENWDKTKETSDSGVPETI